MQTDIKKQENFLSAWLDILLLAIFFLVTYSLFLGFRSLGVPDEARYSEIPREMLLLHSYITPHLDFVKYFEKPPLFYWVQAFFLNLFGLQEWAARLSTMLISVCGILVTYASARHMFNRKIALISASVLGSSLLYYAMGHLITTDMTLSFLLTTSLFTFFCATRLEQSRAKRLLVYCAFICSALAVLTKGLIGIVFPCMIFGLWILLNNQWHILKKMYLPSAIVLFLVVALPWHIAVQIQNPEFFHFYFITQQFARYTTMVAERYQPAWFFFAIVIVGLFPWIVFFLQSLFHSFKQWKDHRFSFLLIWAISIFVFYSCSHSKLIPYIIPIFPALTILIASYLAEQKRKGMLIGFTVLVMLSIIILIGAPIGIEHAHNIIHPHHVFNLMIMIGVLFVIGSIASFIFFLRKDLKLSVATLTLFSVIACITLNVAANDIDSRSIKPLAMTINRHFERGNRIVAYGHYYQDLPYYTRQKVIIVGWKNELTFGLAHQPSASKWVTDDKGFAPIWHGKQRVFVIVRKKHFDNFKKLYPKFTILGKTQRNILLSNQGVAR